jgi:hypothetical protein
MNCPNPELLSAAAEGRLDLPLRDAVLDHAADCDLCRHTLLILSAAEPAVPEARPTGRSRAVTLRPAPAFSPVPWAVAAALLLSALGLFILAGRTNQTELPEVKEVAQAKLEEPPVAPEPGVPPPLPVRSRDPFVPEYRRTEEPGKENRPTPKPEEPPGATEVPPLPPAPPPPPAGPEPEKAAPRRDAEKAPTAPILAKVDRMEGEVYALSVTGKVRAHAGLELKAGEGLQCVGARSWALVKYPDKSRLELSGDTRLGSLTEVRGKRIALEQGIVKAEVAKQPKDQPMIFATPQGEARVVGTILRLVVDADPKKGTTLEVEEGRVDLAGPSGKTVEVTAGHVAVAAVGVPLAPKLLAREEILLALDFEDAKKPSVVDLGTVERGPGNRLCLAGEPDPSGVSKVQIGGGPDGLFTFAGDEVLSFDYWADPQASQVNFNFWDRTQARTHEGQVTRVVPGKWTRVSFKLSELGDPGSRLREGDWVAGIYLQATGPGPRRLFIDNVLIVRQRTLRPKAIETRK